MTDSNSAAGGPSPVHALVQQRDQLRTWIAKLDEVAQGAPTRVAERIRQDYGDRLARVTAELGEHRDEIGRNLESMRAELHDAEERHTQASEALEEMRLRHLIGELDDASWGTQRERLESELSAAESETRRIGGEVERLSVLAGEVGRDATDTGTAFASAAEEPGDDAGAPPPAEPQDDRAETHDTGWLNEISLDPPASPAPLDPPAAAAAEEASAATWDPFGNEFGGAPETPQSDVGGGDLPWLETPDRAADAWTPGTTEDDGLEFLNDLGTSTPETPSTSDLAEDDLAFLEELDRAISGSPGTSRPDTPPPASSTPAPAAAPAPGSSGGPLLCKECGAINEPHSWYCEICGSEL